MQKKDHAREDRRKIEQVERRATPPSPIIYEAIRRNGEELGANLTGTLVAASFATFLPVVPRETFDAMLVVSEPRSAATGSK